jgi:predicted RNase H-like HicB family nuclease
MNTRLLVEVEPLEEGGYLASCALIQGCHAEGRTIGEAIDNLQSVIQVIYDLCRDKGLPFITGLADVPIERIVWQIEFSTPLELAS